MRVVVAGGSGFIGSAVCRLLRARGHDAIVLSRKRKNDPTWCTWDDVRTRGLPECDAVVTLCGENFLDSRWTASRKAALEASRIDTTKELVALCQEMARPPRVFVQASGVGFYPPSESATYDEKYSGPPANDYAGWLTQAWEQASDPLAQPSSHTKRVLMRTGVVLGQGGALAAMRLPFGLAYVRGLPRFMVSLLLVAWAPRKRHAGLPVGAPGRCGGTVCDGCGSRLAAARRARRGTATHNQRAVCGSLA